MLISYDSIRPRASSSASSSSTLNLHPMSVDYRGDQVQSCHPFPNEMVFACTDARCGQVVRKERLCNSFTCHSFLPKSSIHTIIPVIIVNHIAKQACYQLSDAIPFSLHKSRIDYQKLKNSNERNDDTRKHNPAMAYAHTRFHRSRCCCKSNRYCVQNACFLGSPG